MRTLIELVWPIRRDEAGRFFPAFLLGLLVCFNYSLLRCLKDTIVVIPSSSGAGVLPFLKLWGVLPAVLIMTFLLSRLFRKLPRSRVYYLVVGTFLAYFALFTLYIYPNRELLALDSLAHFLTTHLPLSFRAPIEMIQQWPLSLFYVVAELWKVAVLMILFWGFMNSRTPLDQARRLYAPLMVGGSIAGIMAGQAAVWISQLVGEDAWQDMLLLSMGLVTLVGLLCLLLYRRIDKTYGVPAKEADDPIIPAYRPRSAWDAFKLVCRSRVLMCIALVIVAEYIAFNLVQVLWKQQIKELYPNPVDFCAYNAKVLIWTGVAGVLASLFISGNVIRFFGWTAVTLLTPLVLLLTSAVFFGFTLYGGAGAIGMAVLAGSIHNIVCRASRQAFADPAKEMAYVPLPPDLQTQGKTFVDGMSPTMGKTGASLMQQGLLLLSPTIMGIAPYCGAIVLFASLLAGSAVFLVGADYRHKLSAKPTKAQPVT